MNEIIKKLRNNQSILIAFFKLIVGVILLSREIRDFVILPMTTEVWEIISLFKYKENTYCLLYLWTILLISGISHWINVKIYWIFNQILLITILFAVVLRAELIFSFYFNYFFVLLPFLVVLLSIWINIKTFRKSYLKTIGIDSRMIRFSILLGVISSLIYFLLAVI